MTIAVCSSYLWSIRGISLYISSFCFPHVSTANCVYSLNQQHPGSHPRTCSEGGCILVLGSRLDPSNPPLMLPRSLGAYITLKTDTITTPSSPRTSSWNRLLLSSLLTLPVSSHVLDTRHTVIQHIKTTFFKPPSNLGLLQFWMPNLSCLGPDFQRFWVMAYPIDYSCSARLTR